MPGRPPSEARPPPRYRVLLVRVPPDARTRVRAVLPRGRRLDREKLPLVTRVTGEREVAERTAERLRAAGAVVVIAEEPSDPVVSAFCSTHHGCVASDPCISCGEPACARCVEEAEGEVLCPRCRREGRSPRRWTRLRQLFVLFLFTVFLYEVVAWLRVDRATIGPAGPVDVAILQYLEPGPRIPDVVRALNGQVPGVPSFYDIAPFYNRERARYGGSRQPYMRVHVLGPWRQPVRPPEMDADSVVLAAWQAWRYARYFRALARERGVDLSKYGSRITVVYSDEEGDLAAESRGSRKGRMAIVYVSANESNPAYAVLTVAHEIGHTLGADDTYDPRTFRARFPEGLAEPWLDPPYPQRYAELMAGDIPLSPTREREVTSLDEVRIGYHSAAGMGWITAEQAELYYDVPPSAAARQWGPVGTGGRVPAAGEPGDAPPAASPEAP